MSMGHGWVSVLEWVPWYMENIWRTGYSTENWYWKAGRYGVRLEGPASLPMIQNSGPTPGEDSGSKARDESMGSGQISAGQSVFLPKRRWGWCCRSPLLQIGGSTIDCPGSRVRQHHDGLYVSPCSIERSEIARPWCAHPDPAQSVEDHAHRGTADPQVPGGGLSGRTHLVAGVRDLCSIEEKTGETMAPAARCESAGR